MSETTEVYIFQGIKGGPFKIGLARAPLDRLRNVQVGNPLKLKIAGRIEYPSFELADQAERIMHMHLARWNMSGEWFWPCPECVNALEEHKPYLTGLVKMHLDSVKAYEAFIECAQEPDSGTGLEWIEWA